MTQEIEKAIIDASQIYPAIHQKPYLDGGIFGYKLAIDKACEWLEFVFKELEISGIDDWVESFKYAMKGE